LAAERPKPRFPLQVLSAAPRRFRSFRCNRLRGTAGVHPHSQNKEKPPLVRGIAYAHHIRGADEPKSRVEDMPSDYQAGTSRTFRYAEADSGKVAGYATAYENSTGARGPWSNAASLLISG
jgi:hypothetical protein